MAANRTWSAEFPCRTRITSLATNTALGTATEHDFADINVRLPENAAIRMAVVKFNCADEFAAAADIDAFRVGVQIDAVAFSDTDTTVSLADTGDHTRFETTVDVTSYFQTNFPTDGQGADVGIRVRVATESAQNVNGVAAKLIITYAFDTADSTFYLDGTEQEVVGGWVKTVKIPIHSHYTTISTSYVETGTTGAAYDAPVNQIPNLEDLLTDRVNITSGNMKGVLATWIEIEATSQGAGTDMAMTCRFDGSTDVARYNVENSSLSTNVTYFDRVTLGGSGVSADFTMTTNAAHAFECKSSIATSFERIGAVLCVTYIANPSQTTAFNSIQVPLDCGRSEVAMTIASPSGAIDVYNADLNIQEPGPIVMRQSAYWLAGQANNTSKSVETPGQLARVYIGASSAVRDGAAPIVHRFDHGDPTDIPPSYPTTTLMRGFNRLQCTVYATTATTNATPMGGYAIVNYHSGIAVDASSVADPWSHAHTVVFPVFPTYHEIAANTRTVSTPTAPNLVEDYTLIGSWVHLIKFGPAESAGHLGMQRRADEGVGAGWEHVNTMVPGNEAENGPKSWHLTTTDLWREHALVTEGVDYLDQQRMDIEGSRGWAYYEGVLFGRSALHYVTIHSIKYTLSGTYNVNGVGVTGTGIAPSGGYGVEVSWRDQHGVRAGVLRRNLPVTAGAWSTVVYDDTVIYNVTGRNGATHFASASGFITRNKGNTEAPKIVGVGAYSSSSASFTMTAGEHRWGDLIVLFVESTNGNDVTTPTGFAVCPDSPQEGTAAQLSAFLAVAKNEGDQYNEIAGPTIAGFTNHASGFFVVVRGANVDNLYSGGDVASTTSAIDDTEGGTATTSTSLTVSGATSTVANTLVLVAYAGDVDTVALTDQTLNTWANAALDGLRGAGGNSTALGDGGNISIARGLKHAAGAIGNTTATLSNTSTHCKLCVAIKPQVYTATTFALSFDDTECVCGCDVAIRLTVERPVGDFPHALTIDVGGNSDSGTNVDSTELETILSGLGYTATLSGPGNITLGAGEGETFVFDGIGTCTEGQLTFDFANFTPNAGLSVGTPPANVNSYVTGTIDSGACTCPETGGSIHLAYTKAQAIARRGI